MSEDPRSARALYDGSAGAWARNEPSSVSDFTARPAVSADNKYLYFISNRGAQKERDDSLQIWRITF